MLNMVAASLQATMLVVALGDSEQHVGVARARLRQRGGMGCVAAHRAQVETILEFFEPLGIGIDDGDVVRLGNQVFGYRRSDLARPEYDYFQRSCSA
jgi:hypothetical protein